ncbi:MAG: radical SAM protein [Victivallales bacterium]|nr:radical SAM protein [Victivallales bacterium]
MLLKLALRFLKITDLKLLFKFCYTFGYKSIKAVRHFERRRLKERHPFPAFIVISVTNRCNLRCQGCWMSVGKPGIELDQEQIEGIIAECKRNGSYFFGILGGEPLMHSSILDIIGRHPECYFQLFTNGTLVSDEIAARLRRMGNVTPLVSIEGLGDVSDERRGGKDVYQRSLAGLKACVRNHLITGVATSVCRSNINELVSDSFVKDLMDMGVLYLWYYIYRPVGENPCSELALDEEDILRLRRFIVETRVAVPMIIVDAYWDADGRALCPGAMGISHHIGPAGDLEFCPPLQFSKNNICRQSLNETLTDAGFMPAFRRFASSETRGCVLLEKPAELLDFLCSENARDSSLRDTAYDELAETTPSCGHHIPGKEIPERHWAYRIAKKYFFFGFGAYG